MTPTPTPDPHVVYTHLMEHQQLATLSAACTCGTGDPTALLDTGEALRAHRTHLADVLCALPQPPWPHDDTQTDTGGDVSPISTQYGVQVVWADPAAAGVSDPDEAAEPRWAIFGTCAQAERFARHYTDDLEAGPHNNVAAVNRATRWAKEQYGPWQPTDSTWKENPDE